MSSTCLNVLFHLTIPTIPTNDDMEWVPTIPATHFFRLNSVHWLVADDLSLWHLFPLAKKNMRFLLRCWLGSLYCHLLSEVDDGVGSVASTAVLSTPPNTNDVSLKEGPFQKVRVYLPTQFFFRWCSLVFGGRYGVSQQGGTEKVATYSGDVKKIVIVLVELLNLNPWKTCHPTTRLWEKLMSWLDNLSLMNPHQKYCLIKGSLTTGFPQ